MPSQETKTNRMTQTQVLDHFADRLGIKRAQARELFSELADLARSEIETTGEFALPNFGKLVKAERKARQERNPATGATIDIAARTTLKFRLSKAIKDLVLDSSGQRSKPPEAPEAEFEGDPAAAPYTESDY